jgi:hypothetical protein
MDSGYVGRGMGRYGVPGLKPQAPSLIPRSADPSQAGG